MNYKKLIFGYGWELKTQPKSDVADRPSYTDPETGSRYWFKNNKFTKDPKGLPWNWGELHRVNGPALERADGTKEWWLNDKRHRTDGPAVELANGDKAWWLNGKIHRTDGPAVEWANGDKSWWLNGKRLNESEFNAIPMDQRNNYGL